MKVNEIITESADPHADFKKLPHDQLSAIKGATTLPSITMNGPNGSPYGAYRFGIALAVADGKKGGKMPASGAMSGDPLLVTYSDEDSDMIKDAADMTHTGPVRHLSSNRSTESSDVNKVSPHHHPGPIRLRSKKK